MNIGFNVNPFSFIETRSDRRAERQRNLDNEFRREQADLGEEWRWRSLHEGRRGISNIVQDARRAGVSPLAALGAGGTTAPSFNIPTGQGGRVQGRKYGSMSIQTQRNKELSHMEKLAEVTALDNAKNVEQFNSYRAARERLQYMNERLDWMRRVEGQEDLPKMYKRAIDNTDEAVGWIRQGQFPYMNQDLNLEMPESVGGYYFVKPRVKDPIHYDKESKTLHFFGDPQLR